LEKNERSKVKAENATVGSAAATGEDQTSQTGEEANYSEADFFQNPYSVLAEIAQEVGQQANVSAKGEGGAADSGPATGASGGEAYRDPFDPDFWTQQVRITRADQRSETQPQDTQQETQATENQQVAAASQQNQQQNEAPQSNDIIADVAKLNEQKQNDHEQQEIAAVIPQQKPGFDPNEIKPTPDPEEAQHKPTPLEEKEAKELRDEIEAQISGVSGKLAEGLIVTPAEGGMLVTISDQSQAPMFNVGSAVPRREMVLAMEKIGQLLQDKGGSVVIRGHTDGRQFKGSSNDNWRLSMDRAHSAYYMLVRGGLEENRVKQVSGFADRRLQIPSDPLADSNRRIEILLEADRG
jgi:chemotaxis protein MotB